MRPTAPIGGAMAWRSAAGLALAAVVAPGAAAQTPAPPTGDGPVEVVVDLNVNKLFGIDTRNETFQLDGYLRGRWRDPRLAAAAGDASCAGASRGRRAGDELGRSVWWPELELINAVGERAVPHRSVSVDCEGNVAYVERFVATFASPMDLRSFPFDRQSFEVLIESYPHDATELVFVSPRLLHDQLDSSAVVEWRLRGLTATTSLFDYSYENDGRPLRYSRAAFALHVARARSYYVWHFLVPLGFIVAVSWLVFWLPTFSERLRTALTLLLTIIAFSFTTAALLPKLPYTTFIDSLLISAHVSIFAEISLVALAQLATMRGRDGFATRFLGVCRWVFPAVNLLAVGLLAGHRLDAG